MNLNDAIDRNSMDRDKSSLLIIDFEIINYIELFFNLFKKWNIYNTFL